MNIAIIGEGGQAKAIQEIICGNVENKVVGYLDDHYLYIAFKDNQFCGPITSADKIIKLYKELKYVIGIENNAIRKSIVLRLGLPNDDYATIIHKTAVISPSAIIGHGTVIRANAVVNANAKIGNHCIIGTNSIVEHDNILGDFVHLSPNSTLSAKTKIGEGTLIEAGVTVMPISINEWVEIR